MTEWLHRADDEGSAVAENVMTTALLVAVFLVVCQFAYAVHVRSVVTMAASEGARYGARVGGGVLAGQQRTEQLVHDAVRGRADVSASQGDEAGVRIVAVHVRAPIPILGPFPVGLTMETTGRAVVEER